MNKAILDDEIQDFINENLNTDIAKLLLKKNTFDEVSTKEIVNQIEAKKKCKTKLQSWFNTPKVYFPNKLNIEQTSSELTAKYKAGIISGKSIIDLTGGFGVDCYYFSKRVDEVTHCEINNTLSEIVNYNLKLLKVKNIKTKNCDGLEHLKNCKMQFDWIYIDPSRRSEIKGKVFLLEDCIPDVPNNLSLLFKHSKNILLKYSPILDITEALKKLKFVNEIHIVAVQNEVKELLFILKETRTLNPIIKTINIQKNEIDNYNFTSNNNAIANYGDIKKYIYEPNSAILKSGGFQEISRDFKLDKLHQNTHLYSSDELIDFPGRRFEVKHITKFDKKQLNKLIPSKKANITTRNFPQSVAEIRKKTKLKDGGHQYLFFTTDFNNNHVVLICEKA